jgi:hypothetical protein
MKCGWFKKANSGRIPQNTALIKLKMGWPTGFEPATARSTIWGSNRAELWPPTRTSELKFLATGRQAQVVSQFELNSNIERRTAGDSVRSSNPKSGGKALKCHQRTETRGIIYIFLHFTEETKPKNALSFPPEFLPNRPLKHSSFSIKTHFFDPQTALFPLSFPVSPPIHKKFGNEAFQFFLHGLAMIWPKIFPRHFLVKLFDPSRPRRRNPAQLALFPFSFFLLNC